MVGEGPTTRELAVTITGDPATDQGLLALARLALEIARNTTPAVATARPPVAPGCQGHADAAPGRGVRSTNARDTVLSEW